MGKAARLKRERQRAAAPPPVGKRRPSQERMKLVWAASGAIVVVIGIVVGVLLATRSSPKAPPPANPSAADQGAPASLVKAADAVNFHPTTEAGVGQIESQPASAAKPSTNGSLLPVGSKAPAFTLKTPAGQKVGLSGLQGKAVLLEFFATWCPHCNAEAPHLRTPVRVAAEEQLRVRLDQRRRRGRGERLRVPPLLRLRVPGGARSRRPDGKLQRRPRVGRAGVDCVPGGGLPHLLRPRSEGADRLALRRRAAGCASPSGAGGRGRAWLGRFPSSDSRSGSAQRESGSSPEPRNWPTSSTSEPRSRRTRSCRAGWRRRSPTRFRWSRSWSGSTSRSACWCVRRRSLACALMVVFIVAQSQAWARGLTLDCGCFGALAQQKVGLASVLRDAALGLPEPRPRRLAGAARLDRRPSARQDRSVQTARVSALPVADAAVPISGLTGSWNVVPGVLALCGLALALFLQAFVRLRRRGRTDHAPWTRARTVSRRTGARRAAARLAARCRRRRLPALGSHAPARADRRRRSAHCSSRRFAGRCSSSSCRRRSSGRWPGSGGCDRRSPSCSGPESASRSGRSTLGSWHVPAAYDYVLEHQTVHDLEHLSFTVAGLLVWTQLVDPARRGALSPARRLGLAAVLFSCGLALADTLVFSFHTLYPSYASHGERLFGIGPLLDQQLAGVVMMVEQLASLGLCCAFLVRLWRARSTPDRRADGGTTDVSSRGRSSTTPAKGDLR